MLLTRPLPDHFDLLLLQRVRRRAIRC